MRYALAPLAGGAPARGSRVREEEGSAGISIVGWLSVRTRS
jgi:hypothetical protein